MKKQKKQQNPSHPHRKNTFLITRTKEKTLKSHQQTPSR